VASLRPLDAAMGYLVLWDKQVVNGGIVCAVGAVGVAATCLSMFVDRSVTASLGNPWFRK
jgi:hypothetical protein